MIELLYFLIKGNIIILDKASDRKVIVRDQHQGPIVDAAWSNDGILATCSSIKHVLDEESKSVTSLLIFTFMDGEQASPPRECPYGKAKRLRFAASKFAPIGQRPQNTVRGKAHNSGNVILPLIIRATLQYNPLDY